MWMFSKEFKDDVFVAMIKPNSTAIRFNEAYKTTTHIHGDILTFWNPKRNLWDNGELTDFLPPRYHTF